MTMTTIALLAAGGVQWLAIALFTASVAEARGYGWGRWFLGGLFFHVFALIAAVGMPVYTRP